MSTSWSTVKEAVRSAVALALDRADRLGADGVTTLKEVDWVNQPRAGARWGTSGILATLQMLNVKPLGDGETRYEYDVDTDSNIPSEVRMTEFTVRVRIESDDQVTYDAPAELAGRLRMRLRTQGPLALLRAANIGVVKLMPTMQIDAPDYEDRMRSVSATDVRFCTQEVWTDDTADGSYVGTADGEGTLTDAAGGEKDLAFDTR